MPTHTMKPSVVGLDEVINSQAAIPKETLKGLTSERLLHGRKFDAHTFPRSFIEDARNRFCYMFPGLSKAKKGVLVYNDENKQLLIDLGNAMADPAKINDNTRDSNIPAGYTYLGQFIDHDITFDPFSNINKIQNPEKTVNLRTPSFELDSVYGLGPVLNPYLYDSTSPGGAKLLLGTNTLPGKGGPTDDNLSPAQMIELKHWDVPRIATKTAIIGDPRNDENLFVSQLHHAFLRFHNKIVDKLEKDLDSKEQLFPQAKRIAIEHYQWIVLNDFLRTIAGPDVVDDVLLNKPKFFPVGPFAMPVEFSVGAYRFGHSMVRDTYHFNSNFINQGFENAFRFVRSGAPVPSTWVVDFNMFFKTGKDIIASGSNPVQSLFNMAKNIDTAIALPLEGLPSETSGSLMAVLAARNLVRGLAFRLPSGQAIASKMKIPPLKPEQLLANTTVNEVEILHRFKDRLLNNTPLWYYILKEAEILNAGQQLGPVGGRIIVETFYRILKDDKDSILNKTFTPTLPHKFDFGSKLIAGKSSSQVSKQFERPADDAVTSIVLGKKFNPSEKIKMSKKLKPVRNFTMVDLLNFAHVLEADPE